MAEERALVIRYAVGPPSVVPLGASTVLVVDGRSFALADCVELVVESLALAEFERDAGAPLPAGELGTPVAEWGRRG